MKENKKLLVWTDQYDTAWGEEYKAEHPDATDEEIMNAWDEEAEISFHDEKDNLNIPVDGEILVIKTLNLWNGQKVCCSVIRRNTIGDLLERFMDGNTFYVDAETGDFICEAYHHDGTNCYCFREISADAPNDHIDDLIYKIEDGEKYDRDLHAFTNPFGGRIAKVYGWEVNANDAE